MFDFVRAVKDFFSDPAHASEGFGGIAAFVLTAFAIYRSPEILTRIAEFIAAKRERR